MKAKTLISLVAISCIAISLLSSYDFPPDKTYQAQEDFELSTDSYSIEIQGTTYNANVYDNSQGNTLYSFPGAALMIKRPMLVVEGFDPGNESNVQDYTDLAPAFFEDLITSESDFYFLNFNDGGADLRENSMVVLGALRFISNHYDMSEGITVCGISMGGVLTRYALAYAEEHYVDHFTKMFISYDSPQRGAIISRNFQVWVDNHKSWSPDIQEANDELGSMAAKQLMIDNWQATHDFSIINSDHAEVYAELNSDITSPNITILNGDGYPHYQNRIHNVAVSNGCLSVSGNVNNESLIFEISHVVPYLGIYCPECGVIFGTLWCNHSQHDFDQVYPITGAGYDQADKQPGSVLPFENDSIYPTAPDLIGSLLRCFKSFETMEIEIPGVTYPIITIDYYYSPVFIPTRSSLHLGGEMTDYSEITSSHSELIAESMFDEIYVEDYPQQGTESYVSYAHAFFNPNAVEDIDNWMDNDEYRVLNTISGYTNAFPTLSYTVNGQAMGEIAVSESGYFEIPNRIVQDCTYGFSFNGDTSATTVSMPYNAMDYEFDELLSFDIATSENAIVSQDPEVDAFRSIQEAVNYAHYYYSGVRRIVIDEGTYDEDVDINSSFLQDMTIMGLNPDNVVIEGKFNINVCKEYSSLSIKNITFSGPGESGIRIGHSINTSTEAIPVTIENCVFDECSQALYTSYPIHVVGSTFTHNYSHLDYYGFGAAIIANSSSNSRFHDNDILIEDCVFFENQANEIAPVFWGDQPVTDEFNFINNRVERNTVWGFNMIYGKPSILIAQYQYVTVTGNVIVNNGDPDDASLGAQLRIQGTSYHNDFNFDVSDNIFINNDDFDNSVDYQLYNDKNIELEISTASVNMSLLNNTFIMNDDIEASIAITDQQDDPNSQYRMMNNIFYSSETGSTGEDIHIPSQGNSTKYSDYNLYYGVDREVYSFNGSHCILGTDPQLDDNFTPIWTSSSRSPVIDAGDPYANGTYWYDEGGQKDADGTRPDIGAVPAESHQTEIKGFLGQCKDYSHWVCFPVVDMRTTGYNVAEDYFGDMITGQPRVIENIKFGVTADRWIQYINGAWINLDHEVTYAQGYIVNMDEDYGSTYPLECSGFLAPTNTRIYLEENNVNNPENWIGYFLEEEMEVFNAFDPVIDHLTEIRTERWAMYKLPDGSWLQSDKEKTLHYGEMVRVVCDQDCDFIWGDDNIVPSDDGYKETKYYDFEKEEDYASIFVELESEGRSMPEEVAVFLNGECCGASVVDDSLVQINAYVLSDTTGNDIEIELYYGDRAPCKTVKDYAVIDPVTRKLEGSRLNFSDRQSYYYINLGMDTEEMIPAETAMDQNYPNPFNPTTTIKYSLNQDGPVEIAVYNLKGQKVRQLINANLTAGFHEVVWDGKDSYGKQASSGIYFYRMKTSDKSFVKKMMMIK